VCAIIEYLSRPEQVDFPDEWYGYCKPDHFWFMWRLSAALAQWREVGLALDRPQRVLDVGSGMGLLREQVEARTAWAVDLADLNVPALQAARNGRGRVLCYDVLEKRTDMGGAYDVVVLFDVLEHIVHTTPFLHAVAHHLRPGGHLLVNVPAGPRLFSQYDVAANHQRRYDAPSLRAEFDGLEMRIGDLRYWGLTMLPLLVFRKWLLSRRGADPSVIRTGFQPPTPLVHALLRAASRLETFLIRRPWRGTSLLLVANRL
jgi:SAM-dependent methyltransferase